MKLPPKAVQLGFAGLVLVAGFFATRTAHDLEDVPRTFDAEVPTSCGLADTYQGVRVCTYRLTVRQERERSLWGRARALLSEVIVIARGL